MTVQVDGLQEEKQSAQHGTKPTVSFVPSGEWGGCRRLLKASSLCCECPWTCQGSSVGEKGAGVLPDAEGSAGRRAAPVQERPKQRGERKGGEKAGVAPTARLPHPSPSLGTALPARGSRLGGSCPGLGGMAWHVDRGRANLCSALLFPQVTPACSRASVLKMAFVRSSGCFCFKALEPAGIELH